MELKSLIRRSSNAIKELETIIKSNEHVAAGLEIHLTVGPADSQYARQIRVDIGIGSEQVLDALLTARKAGHELLLAQARRELKELEALLDKEKS